MNKDSGWLRIHLRTAELRHPSKNADLSTSRLILEQPKVRWGQIWAAAVRKWIRSLLESFFMDGMKKWIERLTKCGAVSSDYVVK
ncbi:hypothetical protein TNCV_3420001 [Trichonephila clavipes]|nr:hypothetical protein TNCV_3420001 [Trichonephila clavipes]